MKVFAPGLKTEVVVRVDVSGMDPGDIDMVQRDANDFASQMEMDYGTGAAVVEVESNEDPS